MASARADGLVRVWNTANTASPILQWALQTTSEQGSVRTFAARFDPSGRQLVSGRSDGTIDVWSLPGRTEPDRGGTITGVDTDDAQLVLATVGASVAIVFGWSVLPGAGPFIVTANAFVFALGASLVLFFMTRLRGVSAETMILVGIALLFTCNAVTALLQYRSNEVQLTQIVFWTLGSLARASWGKVGVAAVLIGLALPFFLMRG